MLSTASQGSILGCIYPQAKPTSVRPPPALSFLCNKTVCVCVAGGRFKKEIVVDGQSYLLLIRDEGGPPEAQVSTTRGLLTSFRLGFPC